MLPQALGTRHLTNESLLAIPVSVVMKLPERDQSNLVSWRSPKYRGAQAVPRGDQHAIGHCRSRHETISRCSRTEGDKCEGMYGIPRAERAEWDKCLHDLHAAEASYHCEETPAVARRKSADLSSTKHPSPFPAGDSAHRPTLFCLLQPQTYPQTRGDGQHPLRYPHRLRGVRNGMRA